MAIWDTLGNNPLQAMILGQALQGFAGGLSKRNGPPSNAYVPQGYGGGGGQGGGGFDIGDMLRMQQLQAQQANMTADNELARQQFEAKQTAAQQAQTQIEAAAKALGVDPSVLALNSGEFGKNAAERIGVQTLSPGQRAMVGDQVISNNPALLDATAGGFANLQDGTFATNPAMLRNELMKSTAGATRISNPVTITQDTLAAKLTEVPSEQFKALSQKAEEAQSVMDSTRSIYELAKLNPDLLGKGMDWTAKGASLVEAARKAVAGGNASPEQERLLAVAQAMDIRQSKGAVATLRNVGGNDTEKEYDRAKKMTAGIDTSLPAHELIYIQEKTSSDYLNNMLEYVSNKLDSAQKDRSIGISTVDQAKREYMRAHPLGDILAANYKAVMAANNMTPTGGVGKSVSGGGSLVDKWDPVK